MEEGNANPLLPFAAVAPVTADLRALIEAREARAARGLCGEAK